MDLSKVTAGRNPPKEIHAFIEIPFGGVPVKYELDKGSGSAVTLPHVASAGESMIGGRQLTGSTGGCP